MLQTAEALQRQAAAVAENRRPFHRVLQLAHIARPTPRLQVLDDMVVDGLLGDALAPGEGGQEGIGQLGDILGPVP
ncbi:hypothetical protein G6F62_014448 [Rhizopus arrhizus]|nr:hypothetical protein G6F24_017434 [Rhizopus arrhizus]KAG1311332.1 hypothetical protein G6F62_014448 [Rhizopus arrhizus]